MNQYEFFVHYSETVDELFSESKLRQEEQVLVLAIRDTFLPRMQGRDGSMFSTLVTDIWPHVDVPMVFGGEKEAETKLPLSRGSSVKPGSSRIKTAKSQESYRSLKGKNNKFVIVSVSKIAIQNLFF